MEAFINDTAQRWDDLTYAVLKFLDPTQEERVVDLENGKLEEVFG